MMGSKDDNSDPYLTLGGTKEFPFAHRNTEIYGQHQAEIFFSLNEILLPYFPSFQVVLEVLLFINFLDFRLSLHLFCLLT